MKHDPGLVFQKAKGLEELMQREQVTKFVNLTLFQLVRERNYAEVVDKMNASLVFVDQTMKNVKEL